MGSQKRDEKRKKELLATKVKSSFYSFVVCFLTSQSADFAKKHKSEKDSNVIVFFLHQWDF